jgi:hypothetical protein
MKKSLLQEMIREELANRMAEENEPMFNSPQAQQSQVNSWAKQVEELKAVRDSLDNQIREIEELANLLNVNEGQVEDKAAMDAERLSIDKKIAALNKRKQDLTKPGASATLEETQLDEETLNEMPFIGGEKGVELFNAIKASSEKLKDQFPEATAKDISKIILSKKKRPELAPEVEDALLAQEEKYGSDPNYTATLGGPQTERAVTKALGEYTPGQRGRKPMEKPATAPTTTPKATTSSPEKDEDSKALAAAEKGAESKGTSSQDKYSALKKALDDKTAELKAMSGSSDMEKRKALTAEKYRIESAIEKLKKVK